MLIDNFFSSTSVTENRSSQLFSGAALSDWMDEERPGTADAFLTSTPSFRRAPKVSAHQNRVALKKVSLTTPEFTREVRALAEPTKVEAFGNEETYEALSHQRCEILSAADLNGQFLKPVSKELRMIEWLMDQHELRDAGESFGRIGKVIDLQRDLRNQINSLLERIP